ncbi:MAG TPA: biotin/lipoyl-containing protein [Candidatus Dormibacteraeota bacterium]|nr:biotin/lipoyl-containing protein [Candidatus Dormibacteraeota bacterium]
MPEAGPKRDRQAAADPTADHAGIARLTDELLPALIAKLATTQLGELEVREGDWHIRLRRPYGIGPGEGRRASDKPSRSQPGHEGHGHPRAAVEGHRPGRSSIGSPLPGGTGTTAGTGAASASNGTGGQRPHAGRGDEHDDDGVNRSRSIATSPAVGIFNPGPKGASGTRVRSGDVLGTVDVLGVRQDVQAPADGVVGATLVEAGMAVEYGQDLFRIELTAPAGAG